MPTSVSEHNVYDILSSRPELDRQSALRAALEAGADPNLPDRRGYLPLSCSSVYGDPVLFELLLRAGADPNAKKWPIQTQVTSTFETSPAAAARARLCCMGPAGQRLPAAMPCPHS